MDPNRCRMDCPSYLKTVFGIFYNFNLKFEQGDSDLDLDNGPRSEINLNI